MLDTGHLIGLGLFSGLGPPQVFYGGKSDWQVWTKPRGCRLVYMVFIGAGGGGGGGGIGVAANAGGGGGGAGGGITKMLWPAFALPSSLYIQLGSGGAGGAGQNASQAAVAGSSGGASYLAFYPSSTGYYASQSIVNGGGGGGAGGAAAGTGGSAASTPVATTTQSIARNGAMFISVGSASSGAAGGLNANGSNVAVDQDALMSSGAGGAGQAATPTARNGGSITQNGVSPENLPGSFVLQAATAGQSASSPAPNDGGLALTAFRLRGGVGGSSAGGANQGGTGGRGQFGCGGGGGGASVHSVVGALGGTGGRGGDAIAYIWCL